MRFAIVVENEGDDFWKQYDAAVRQLPDPTLLSYAANLRRFGSVELGCDLNRIDAFAIWLSAAGGLKKSTKTHLTARVDEPVTLWIAAMP